MILTHPILAQAFTTDIGAQALQVVELLLTPRDFSFRPPRQRSSQVHYFLAWEPNC